jgi:hypothetical protein
VGNWNHQKEGQGALPPLLQGQRCRAEESIHRPPLAEQHLQQQRTRKALSADIEY